MLVALLLAGSGGGSGGASIDVTSLLGPILNVGLIGVILVLLIFEIGFITKKSHDREIKAKEKSHEAECKTLTDALESQRADISELKLANGSLQVLVQDKMIPALVQSTEVSRAYVTELARRNDRRDDG